MQIEIRDLKDDLDKVRKQMLDNIQTFHLTQNEFSAKLKIDILNIKGDINSIST
jgi:hypothetical protein